jgi:hypothetical protein
MSDASQLSDKDKDVLQRIQRLASQINTAQSAAQEALIQLNDLTKSLVDEMRKKSVSEK